MKSLLAWIAANFRIISTHGTVCTFFNDDGIIMYKGCQEIRKLPVKPVTGKIGTLHSSDDIYSSISVVRKANTLYRITVGKLMTAQRARNSFITHN